MPPLPSVWYALKCSHTVTGSKGRKRKWLDLWSEVRGYIKLAYNCSHTGKSICVAMEKWLKEGKADGGICVGHKERKAPNCLPCKGYVEFNNSGKNGMSILRRLIRRLLPH